MSLNSSSSVTLFYLRMSDSKDSSFKTTDGNPNSDQQTAPEKQSANDSPLLPRKNRKAAPTSGESLNTEEATKASDKHTDSPSSSINASVGRERSCSIDLELHDETFQGSLEKSTPDQVINDSLILQRKEHKSDLTSDRSNINSEVEREGRSSNDQNVHDRTFQYSTEQLTPIVNDAAKREGSKLNCPQTTPSPTLNFSARDKEASMSSFNVSQELPSGNSSSQQPSNKISESILEETKRKRSRPKKKQSARYAKMNYTKFEGSFRIQQTEWEPCWGNSLTPVHRSRWARLVKRNFISSVSKYHKFKWKYSGKIYNKKSGQRIVDAYSYCGSGECKHFHLTMSLVSGEDLIIQVFSAGKDNHHGSLTKTCPVKGDERTEDFKPALKNVQPAQFQKQQIRNLDPQVALENNWQTVKGDAALRRMKAEAMAENDMAKDPFFDLVLRRREELLGPEADIFIQETAEPLRVFLYSKNQVKTVLNSFSSRFKIFVHFDATGSLVKMSLHDKKRVYIYSAVVNINGTLVTLFEMISSQHDQTAIGSIFANFRSFCEKTLRRTWPVVGRFVSDCSFAIIHAVLLQWNSMSLIDYLQRTFKYASGLFSATDFSKIVIIHLCKNHWLKMVSMNLKSHMIRGILKAFIMEAMARLMACRSLAQFQTLFRSLATILLSPHDHEGILESFKTLKISPTPSETEDPTITNIADELEDHAFTTTEKLCDTPFHVMCANIIQEVKWEVQHCDGVSANRFLCPQFLNDIFMENSYAALIPMWTEIFVGVRGNADNRFVSSNAPVEGFFKEKKRSVHRVVNNKIGRYVEVEKEDVFTKIKKIDLSIRTDGKVNVDELNSEDEDNPEMVCPSPKTPTHPKLMVQRTATETWGENRKKGFAYADGKLIKGEYDHRRKAAQSAGHNLEVFSPHGDEVKWKRTPKGTPKPTLQTLSAKVRKRLDEDTVFSSPKKRFHPDDLESNSKTLTGRVATMISGHTAYPKKPRRKGLSLKQNKIIHSMKDISNDDRESSVEVVHSVAEPANIQEKIKNSHYLQHHPSAMNTMEQLHLLGELSESEQQHVTKQIIANLHGAFLTYGEDKPLYTSDFLQLLSAAGVNSSVMDACLANIARRYDKSSIYIGSHTDGHQLFTEPFSIGMAEGLNKKNIHRFSKLLIPLGKCGHWSLVYVDLRKQEVAVMDPSGTHEQRQNNIITSLQQYFDCFVPKASIKFKVMRVSKFPLQGDDLNCGVYVLHYVENILENRKNVQFNPQQYRVQLASSLIKSIEEKVSESPSLEPERDILNCLTYENGLISNVKYYNPNLNESRENFVVCQFGQDFNPVFHDDFKELAAAKGWLSSSIIDALIHASLRDSNRHKDTINVLCLHSLDFFQMNINENHVLSQIPFSQKTLLMPINISNDHWCLSVANFERKIFYYLDPKDTHNQNKHFSTFLNAIAHRNTVSTERISTVGWKCSGPSNIPRQPRNDAHNCGVFIIHYALLELGLASRTPFTASEFRKVLATTLLKACPNMRHLCLKCGKDEYCFQNETIGNMIQCNACLRWFHQRCSKPPIKNLEEDFRCYVCTYFLQR